MESWGLGDGFRLSVLQQIQTAKYIGLKQIPASCAYDVFACHCNLSSNWGALKCINFVQKQLAERDIPWYPQF